MKSVNQFTFIRSRNEHYVFDKNMPIVAAPSDTDWSRWAMLGDGKTDQLYFFKGDTKNKIYQFSLDAETFKYHYNSEIAELVLLNIPTDADTSSFSMLHNGDEGHLYLRPVGNPSKIYMFKRSDLKSNKYRYSTKYSVTGFPSDTDWNRWAMLYDGKVYRLYAFRQGSNTEFYQGAWDGSQYKWSYKSIPKLTLEGSPSDSDASSMSMLHDGSHYRFYLQTS